MRANLLIQEFPQYQYSVSFTSLTVLHPAFISKSGYLLAVHSLSHDKQIEFNLTHCKQEVAVVSNETSGAREASAAPDFSKNISFEEVVALASQNHATFYALFQERYPRLHRKLLDAANDLKLSELTLCAYIYLDFSAKDISQHTFRSVRTIQTRKSNLRKRLSIPSSDDIYVWMKNMGSEDVAK